MNVKKRIDRTSHCCRSRLIMESFHEKKSIGRTHPARTNPSTSELLRVISVTTRCECGKAFRHYPDWKGSSAPPTQYAFPGTRLIRSSPRISSSTPGWYISSSDIRKGLLTTP